MVLKLPQTETFSARADVCLIFVNIVKENVETFVTFQHPHLPGRATEGPPETSLGAWTAGACAAGACASGASAAGACAAGACPGPGRGRAGPGGGGFKNVKSWGQKLRKHRVTVCR